MSHDEAEATLSELAQNHLQNLEIALKNAPDPNDLGSKNARTFAKTLEDVNHERLPDKRITRDEVLSFAQDASTNTPTACAAILAWGGMREQHRKSLWANKEWLSLAHDIRGGKYDRRCAYQAFDERSGNDELKGMGPAYFTKLIYFLMPRSGPNTPHAYIMDQWAGCSINMLCDSNIILMDKVSKWKRGLDKPIDDYIVSSANTSENYEKFCAAMDKLVLHFHKTPDQIDRALLGDGGRSPNEWRRYVIENRRQF